ncbi:unnamed protein product, partial [Oikopleura dioica]
CELSMRFVQKVQSLQNTREFSLWITVGRVVYQVIWEGRVTYLEQMSSPGLSPTR